MNARHHPNQFELFPDAPAPPEMPRGLIAGLAVHLDRHCGCGATIAVIVQGKGPHAAALECPKCCRFRQWVPRAVFQFLVELVARCGRPTEAIKIYEQVNRIRQPPRLCGRGE